MDLYLKQNHYAKFSVCLIALVFCLFSKTTLIHAEEAGYGISGNPGAVNILTGTGELGNFLQIPKSSGVRLGGLLHLYNR